MAAYQQTIQQAVLPLLAGKRLMPFPKRDIQQENPRGVGKGRNVTPKATVATGNFGGSPSLTLVCSLPLGAPSAPLRSARNLGTPPSGAPPSRLIRRPGAPLGMGASRLTPSLTANCAEYGRMKTSLYDRGLRASHINCRLLLPCVGFGGYGKELT